MLQTMARIGGKGMTGMSALAVYFIVYAISYPIVYALLKTIEFYFGTPASIVVGVILLIAVIIALIILIRKVEKNDNT